MGYSRHDIIGLLSAKGGDLDDLFALSAKVKDDTVGNGVYLRGLIEFSNICRKNCLYCGIRKDSDCQRYTLADEDVFSAAKYAYENSYGSVVLQGGENTSPQYIARITRLIRGIKELSDGRLGITLSLGEQSPATYREWFSAGAHRYLLRIEASNPELYAKIHPADQTHSYEKRVKAIADLRITGFQVGTGVMIGLPFQTVGDLADDLLFMKRMDIDMCGMGPYIVSHDTPLARFADGLMSEKERLTLTLKMIAVLRLLMPDINIAATTALQAIDPMGRLKAIEVGANVVMPNLTPENLRGNYSLYDNKPLSFDSNLLEKNIKYGQWGDSRHFACRNKKKNG